MISRGGNCQVRCRLLHSPHLLSWGVMRYFLSCCVSIFVAGCASSANDIGATYISPLQYQNYTCEQIAAEAQRISQRVATLSGQQDQKATNDAIATGVAIVIFWPAAFMISGDSQTAAELGRLKGEFETLEKVAIQKNCGLEFRRAPAKRQKTSSARDWSSTN